MLILLFASIFFTAFTPKTFSSADTSSKPLDIWISFNYTKTFQLGGCTITANFTVHLLVNLQQRKIKDIDATITCSALNSDTEEVSAAISFSYFGSEGESEVTDFTVDEASNSLWAEIMYANEPEILLDINNDLAASWE